MPHPPSPRGVLRRTLTILLAAARVSDVGFVVYFFPTGFEEEQAAIRV